MRLDQRAFASLPPKQLALASTTYAQFLPDLELNSPNTQGISNNNNRKTSKSSSHESSATKLPAVDLHNDDDDDDHFLFFGHLGPMEAEATLLGPRAQQWYVEPHPVHALPIATSPVTWPLCHHAHPAMAAAAATVASTNNSKGKATGGLKKSDSVMTDLSTTTTVTVTATATPSSLTTFPFMLSPAHSYPPQPSKVATASASSRDRAATEPRGALLRRLRSRRTSSTLATRLTHLNKDIMDHAANDVYTPLSSEELEVASGEEANTSGSPLPHGVLDSDVIVDSDDDHQGDDNSEEGLYFGRAQRTRDSHPGRHSHSHSRRLGGSFLSPESFDQNPSLLPHMISSSDPAPGSGEPVTNPQTTADTFIARAPLEFGFQPPKPTNTSALSRQLASNPAAITTTPVIPIVVPGRPAVTTVITQTQWESISKRNSRDSSVATSLSSASVSSTTVTSEPVIPSSKVRARDSTGDCSGVVTPDTILAAFEMKASRIDKQRRGSTKRRRGSRSNSDLGGSVSSRQDEDDEQEDEQEDEQDIKENEGLTRDQPQTAAIREVSTTSAPRSPAALSSTGASSHSHSHSHSHSLSHSRSQSSSHSNSSLVICKQDFETPSAGEKSMIATMISTVTTSASASSASLASTPTGDGQTRFKSLRPTPPGGPPVYGWGDKAVTTTTATHEDSPAEQAPRFFKVLADRRFSTNSNPHTNSPTPEGANRGTSSPAAATTTTTPSGSGSGTVNLASRRPASQQFTDFCRSLSDKFKW